MIPYLIGKLFINRQRVVRVVMIPADLEMGHHVPNVDHPRDALAITHLPRDGGQREHRARSLRGPGMIEANEQVTFPPLPCNRYPASGYPLPDLPPYRC